MSEPKSITKYTENIIDILNYLIENAVPKTSKQLEVKFIKPFSYEVYESLLKAVRNEKISKGFVNANLWKEVI